jgi:biotin carboxylase
MAIPRKSRLLFLFPEGWDLVALERLPFFAHDFEVAQEGFDLFRFPSSANLMWFDAPRTVERLVRRYAGRVDGVLTTNEQFGALVASTVAQRLGLPGTNPVAVVNSQHKYLARRLIAEAEPSASPRFDVIPYGLSRARAEALEYPLFVKPVKAAFSVLARRIDAPAQLFSHLDFAPWEKHVIRRLIRPFDDLMRLHVDTEIDTRHLLVEEVMEGEQLNVDGYAFAGRIEPLGVVDSVMYPGTSAFQRFEYPSRLPAAVQERAQDLARRLLAAVGFDHGLFNIEMFWDPKTDVLRVIEINPRMAAQFADLYEKVEGFSLYEALLALALGREPEIVRGRGRFGAAASFVFRAFDDAVKREPSAVEAAWLAHRYPDAILQTWIKHGNSRRREVKWLGSYRYALLNLGGRDRDDLFRRFEDVCRHVRFDADESDRIALTGQDALRPR